MSIDALLLHLEEDADREAARLRAEADARAAAHEARAEAEAERRRARHLERVTLERRTALERRVAAARVDARARFLAARERLLDRVFARAADDLERLPVDRYAGSVGALAVDAARYLEGEPAVLRSPPDAVGPTTEAVRALPKLTVQGADAPAGVTGQSEDGRVTVDNTLRAILARRRPDLAIALTARIEGGNDALG